MVQKAEPEMVLRAARVRDADVRPLLHICAVSIAINLNRQKRTLLLLHIMMRLL